MRIEKKIMKELYQDRLNSSNYFVVLGYKSLSVDDIKELKSELAATSSRMTVVKNQVFKHALKENELGSSDRFFEGQNAIVTGGEDVAAVAKIIKKIAGTKPALEIKGGVLDSVLFDEARLDEISKLPSREVLYGMFCGAMNAPISGLVNTMAGIMRDFATTLQAVADKKNEG